MKKKCFAVFMRDELSCTLEEPFVLNDFEVMSFEMIINKFFTVFIMSI